MLKDEPAGTREWMDSLDVSGLRKEQRLSIVVGILACLTDCAFRRISIW